MDFWPIKWDFDPKWDRELNPPRRSKLIDKRFYFYFFDLEDGLLPPLPLVLLMSWTPRGQFSSKVHIHYFITPTLIINRKKVNISIDEIYLSYTRIMVMRYAG